MDELKELNQEHDQSPPNPVSFTKKRSSILKLFEDVSFFVLKTNELSLEEIRDLVKSFLVQENIIHTPVDDGFDCLLSYKETNIQFKVQIFIIYKEIEVDLIFNHVEDPPDSYQDAKEYSQTIFTQNLKIPKEN